MVTRHYSHHYFFSHPSVRTFLLRFTIIFIGITIFFFLFPIIAYQEWIATLVGDILHIPVKGTLLFTQNGTFDITPFCTGITIGGIFAGLIVGFPTLPQKKLFPLLIGIIFLQFLNIIRLLGIVMVGVYFSFPLAETLHVLSWFILSGIGMGIWVVLLMQETNIDSLQELGKKLAKS
ncbi:MAG: exosortase/archaeosortase family protein [Candidatus Diapherotrites archaeon]